MRPANTALRWVLALMGAATASSFGFMIAIALSLVVFVDTTPPRDFSRGRDAIAGALAIMFSTIGWVWAGSAIVPARHRKYVFAVFSSPPIFLLLAVLLRLVIGPGLVGTQVPLAAGLMLAFAGLVILALVWRSWARAAERRKAIEQVANVFSDEPDLKVKAH